MTHAHFRELLSHAAVTHNRSGALTAEARAKAVRVQWDPERTPKIGELPHRSIQIGISGALGKVWCEEWIESIEDVSERARALKETLDRERGVDGEELVKRGLVPEEREYVVDEELRTILEMDMSMGR